MSVPEEQKTTFLRIPASLAAAETGLTPNSIPQGSWGKYSEEGMGKIPFKQDRDRLLPITRSSGRPGCMIPLPTPEQMSGPAFVSWVGSLGSEGWRRLLAPGRGETVYSYFFPEHAAKRAVRMKEELQTTGEVSYTFHIHEYATDLDMRRLVVEALARSEWPHATLVSAAIGLRLTEAIPILESYFARLDRGAGFPLANQIDGYRKACAGALLTLGADPAMPTACFVRLARRSEIDLQTFVWLRHDEPQIPLLPEAARLFDELLEGPSDYAFMLMVVAAHRPLQTHHYTRIQSLMEAPDPESRQLARHALWSSQSPRDAKIAQLATEWFSRETDLDTRFSLAVDLWALLPAELVVSSVAPLLAHENPCDRYQALRALARFPAPLATAIARLGVDDEPDVFLGAALRHYSR